MSSFLWYCSSLQRRQVKDSRLLGRRIALVARLLSTSYTLCWVEKCSFTLENLFKKF